MPEHKIRSDGNIINITNIWPKRIHAYHIHTSVNTKTLTIEEENGKTKGVNAEMKRLLPEGSKFLKHMLMSHTLYNTHTHTHSHTSCVKVKSSLEVAFEINQTKTFSIRVQNKKRERD